MNRNDPSLPTALLAGFSTMKGKPVLFSDFGYGNSWPYSIIKMASDSFYVAKEVRNTGTNEARQHNSSTYDMIHTYESPTCITGSYYNSSNITSNSDTAGRHPSSYTQYRRKVPAR